jgi:hypothetical protein
MAEDSAPEPVRASADPQGAALDKAGEFAKYLAALATGALVFSKDLLGKDFILTGHTRYFILGAWFLLSLSVVAGIFVLARIPMMLREGTHDLEDKYLAFPLRAQQVLCFLGVLALGGALIAILWSRPASAEINKPDLPGTGKGAVSNSCACASPFVMAYSATVRTRSEGPHQHTFLLDQSTGETWEMVCMSGKNVQFRKVPEEGLPRVATPEQKAK